MYTSRMQILLSPAQRRLLEEEARASGASVASLVREAIDARFARPSAAARLEAAERLVAHEAELVEVDELRELIDARFDPPA